MLECSLRPANVDGQVLPFDIAAPPTPAMLSAFRDGMRGRGYVEGQNLSIDVRWPQGSFDQDPSVVTELVNSNVDVIVVWGTPTMIAVRRATSTIPIVMTGLGDPIGSGFIASLARPGGNITGLTNISVDLSAKLMEPFVELVPRMKRVGVVRNPNNPAVTVMLRETEDAVRKLNMQVEVVEAQTPDEFERAFAQLGAESVGGVMLLPDLTVIEHSRRIAELPLSGPSREHLAATAHSRFWPSPVLSLCNRMSAAGRS